MTKNDKAKQWFCKTWTRIKLTENESIAMEWSEFQEACVEAYKAGAVQERKACAKLAEQTICDKHIPTGVNIYGTRAAKAIRARGNT
jgi:hypothetical protein